MFNKIIDILSKHYDGKIDNVELLTGDASSRSYYRASVRGTSKIICIDPADGENYSIERNVEIARLLQEKGVRVPSFEHYSLDQGYSIQEDIGDITLESYLRDNPKHEKPMYEKAIDLMCQFHGIKQNSMACFKLAFDVEKLMFEVNHTRKYYIEGLLGKKDFDLENVFYEFCSEISSLPRVLVHRDYHSRNLMIKNDELVAIDFQDARMGSPLYDLVSLLDDCYVELSLGGYKELKGYYLEQSGFCQKRFEREYALVAVQRIFKAIGSFAYLKTIKGSDRYLQYIKPAYQRLQFFSKKISAEAYRHLERYDY